MPSTSAKQAKFMRAVAHSPKFAKKVGVPQSVGKDFEMADKKKGRKFGSGGAAKKPMMESGRKPIDMRRAILGSDKDIVARGNRTPYEPMPKKGPSAPTKPVKKDPDTLGAKKFAKGGKVKKYAVGGTPPGTPATAAGSTTGSTAAPAPAPATGSTAATPLRNASPRTSGLPGTSGVQLAAGNNPVSTVSTAAPTGPAFNRNQAYQTFNNQARQYLSRGVPKSEIIKQQAILRRLQMDNSSTQAQHQDALNRAMGSLMGMMNAAGRRAAKGGTMKSSDKAGRALVKKSADTKGRAMKYAAGGLAAGHKSANGIAKKGKTKASMVKMAKGGSVSSRADGCAKKGRTSTKHVTMRNGGSC